jgi:hypothetical protein
MPGQWQAHKPHARTRLRKQADMQAGRVRQAHNSPERELIVDALAAEDQRLEPSRVPLGAHSVLSEPLQQDALCACACNGNSTTEQFSGNNTARSR